MEALPSTLPRPALFTNLQVGRFAAAFFVLVSHVAYYGETYLGVPNAFKEVTVQYWFRMTVIFLFALSGFVLTHSLQSCTIRSFVGFRLFRLFAPFWIAVAVVMAVRWSVGNPQSFTWSNLTRSLLLWPSGASKLIPVLTIEWTLIYELFLSMAIVPLACIGRTRALGWGAGIWLMLILGKLSMNPYAETAWLPLLVEVPLSVINVPFLMGILFYFGMPLVRRYHLATLFLIALTLTAGRLFLETSNGWSLILQSTGSAMLVAALATGKQLDVKNPFVIAGDWTYGIYLIHVSVFTAFFALILRYQWFPPSNSLVLFGGVLALAVGSAFGAFECAMYRRVRSAFKVKKPAALIAVPIPYRPKLKIAA